MVEINQPIRWTTAVGQMIIPHSAMVFAHGESDLLPMANNRSCLTLVSNEVSTKKMVKSNACAGS
ncbi:hypothetical protein ACH50_13020 [Franconibacter pulveris]|uniref:Uncharacterized protein n=1 Tax=Franconibacter pulveris TaxID=435910 RepID=A0A0J8VP66_9ENTR|nr:hypothetical protein ACH50_13020 [Franconibacter pulveris]